LADDFAQFGFGGGIAAELARNSSVRCTVIANHGLIPRRQELKFIV
jgi:dienelactone hydrolase